MSIFANFLATPQAAEVLGDQSFIAAMLRFEAALARAQAQAELISQSAAQSIIGTCKVDLFDVPKLVRESTRARCMASPLIKSLRETVGLFNAQAADFVHFGCSNQDVIDSALAIVTRQVLDLVQADLNLIVGRLLELAQRHAADPVLARAPWQSSAISSFGWICSQWAAPLARSRQRLQQRAAQGLCLQLGGALGTCAEMQDKGALVARLMASELGLTAPDVSWQTQRDEQVALACELGLLVGSLGRIAKDSAHMAHAENAELSAQPAETHVVLAAAQRVPQHVATLMRTLAQEQEHELDHWQAALAEWPALLMSTHAATRAMLNMLEALQVNSARMRSNLEARRASLGAKAAAEWFHPAKAALASQLAQQQIAALTNAPAVADAPI